MNKDKPLVWLDAGHGGHDSGALGLLGLRESDVVLDVCLRAKALLEFYGVRVGMTRESDVFETLSRRAEMANEANADIFISVHCNSADNPAEGIETFSAGSTNGSRLAEMIQDEMLDAFPLHVDRGVKTAKFTVLQKTRMPAALAELEFIHTQRGTEHFSQEETLDLCAEALCDASLEYLGISREQSLVKGDGALDDGALVVTKRLEASSTADDEAAAMDEAAFDLIAENLYRDVCLAADLVGYIKNLTGDELRNLGVYLVRCAENADEGVAGLVRTMAASERVIRAMRDESLVVTKRLEASSTILDDEAGDRSSAYDESMRGSGKAPADHAYLRDETSNDRGISR